MRIRILLITFAVFLIPNLLSSNESLARDNYEQKDTNISGKLDPDSYKYDRVPGTADPAGFLITLNNEFTELVRIALNGSFNYRIKIKKGSDTRKIILMR